MGGCSGSCPERGLLLPDLLDRLRGASPVRVPDLSERAADVPGLVRRFAAEAARENSVRECVVTEEFLQEVGKRAWKSVRHLRNAVAYAVAVSGGSVLDPESLPAPMAYRNVSLSPAGSAWMS